jgi:hypothetical protein
MEEKVNPKLRGVEAMSDDIKKKPILCVDYDGVIHSYTTPWISADVIPDPPVPGALAWLVKASEYFDVQIYSSRSRSEAGKYAMMAWIETHAEKEGMLASHLVVLRGIKFPHGKPAAFLTIDDRAVCFRGDWAEIDPAVLINFKPWNKQ